VNHQKAGPVTTGVKVLLTAMYGLPLLWIVLTSFKSSRDVFTTQSSLLFRPTTDAYRNALDGALLDALRQSVLIATGATALVLLIAIPAAYGLARTRGSITTVGLGLLIVLQMMPQTATVIPLFQIFGRWSLLDRTLGVVIADAALLIPFATLLLRPFFRAVPRELEEAGAIDGATTVRTFWSIVLPVARNGAFTVGTLVFLLAWGEFLYAVNFFLSPGSYPLSALLAQQVSAFGIDWPGLMALAVLTSIPILLVFTFTYRLLRDGLTVGAVK
jgi:multiple sugar transport system permease protein